MDSMLSCASSFQRSGWEIWLGDLVGRSGWEVWLGGLVGRSGNWLGGLVAVLKGLIALLFVLSVASS